MANRFLSVVAAVLLGVLVGVSVQGWRGTASEARLWEYKLVRVNPGGMPAEPTMNELSNEGWELVTAWGHMMSESYPIQYLWVRRPK